MTLKAVRISKGITLNTVIFPLTWHEFLNTLEKKGYELASQLPFPYPTGRFSASGPIARKGKTSIFVNTGANIIRIFDISIKSAGEEFDELLKLLVSDYGVDLNAFARFYSFTASYKFNTDKQASQTISDFCIFPSLGEISKIIGKDVIPFGFRLGAADVLPNDENWFDIRIEPDVLRNDCYTIEIVFRNSDKEIIEEFINTIESNLNKIIDLIER